MSPFHIPADEINQRISRFQHRLQTAGIDAQLIIQRVDLYYFSATAQTGWLWIPAEGEPLLLIKRYLPRAESESPLPHIVSVSSVHQVPGLIHDHFHRIPKRIGLELDVMPVNEYRFFQNLFPDAAFVDGSPIILANRQCKSAWEIKQMQHTAAMSLDIFGYMQRALRPGLTEMEFAGLIETHARRLGHGGMLRSRHYQTEAYPWHILSGPSGGTLGMLDSPASGDGTCAAFPAGAGQRELIPGQPIMVDFGSVRNGYHLDETRMFAIERMPAKAAKACQAAIEILEALIATIKPGVTAAEIYDFSVSLATSMGYSDTFLGPQGHKVRFIGHGIGLELIEPPIIAQNKTDVLCAGMTLAIEPKMNFMGEFAAGIESVVQVTATGAQLISQVPADVFYVIS